MEQDDIRSQVHKFIQTNFLFNGTEVIGDDQPLHGSGVVDSTGILELIGFLEDTCQLKFEYDELVPDNFDTINKIVRFIGRKQLKEKASPHVAA